MERVLEPELMDGTEQAEAYAIADFADVNQAFVARFTATFPDLRQGTILDLGCGPADIPIRLCRALSAVRVTGLDGSASMLAFAARSVESCGLEARIRLVRGVLPNPPLGGARFDAIVSNSLLHHLPDPSVLWREVVALARKGAGVLIADLMRPSSRKAAEAIVARYAADERPVLKTDFLNSLCAAFTIEEVEAQLKAAGLDRQLTVRPSSDRHLVVAGRL